MFYFLLISSFILNIQAPGSGEGFDLSIKVVGIDEARGQIGFCLISNEAGYPDDCDLGEWVDVQSKDFSTTIKNVPSGRYAIAIYQDMNGDKKLNKNFLGIPKEKYGFSNNPNSKFGLPDFSDCIVVIDGDKSIVIDI